MERKEQKTKKEAGRKVKKKKSGWRQQRKECVHFYSLSHTEPSTWFHSTCKRPGAFSLAT